MESNNVMIVSIEFAFNHTYNIQHLKLSILAYYMYHIQQGGNEAELWTVDGKQK
jgi:hypothetical protein